MKTLPADQLAILRECVGACSPAVEEFAHANDDECRIIAALLNRGLVQPCYCDGYPMPHPRLTPLGRTALECAKALEKTT